MGKPYANVINRAKVLVTNIEKILERNRELEDSLKKLRQFKDTVEARWSAEVRVARKEIEKQIREENKQPTEEKQT